MTVLIMEKLSKKSVTDDTCTAAADATPSTNEKSQTATSTTVTSPSTSSEQPVEGATSSASSSSANTDPKVALEERVARAKELLEKRRQQKVGNPINLIAVFLSFPDGGRYFGGVDLFDRKK